VAIWFFLVIPVIPLTVRFFESRYRFSFKKLALMALRIPVLIWLEIDLQRTLKSRYRFSFKKLELMAFLILFLTWLEIH